MDAGRFETGEAKRRVDGKLVLKIGKGEKQLPSNRMSSSSDSSATTMYPVEEDPVGGEQIAYQLDPTGAVKYLEVKPTRADHR